MQFCLVQWVQVCFFAFPPFANAAGLVSNAAVRANKNAFLILFELKLLWNVFCDRLCAMRHWAVSNRRRDRDKYRRRTRDCIRFSCVPAVASAIARGAVSRSRKGNSSSSPLTGCIVSPGIAFLRVLKAGGSKFQYVAPTDLSRQPTTVPVCAVPPCILPGRTGCKGII